jgi:transcriptional regulator with GAF, ATPase, and Fis domain
MTEADTTKIDVPLQTSTPRCAASLDSIVCTEELRRRPSRPAEFEKENSALAALVSALADSPGTILQTLADKVLEVLQADSAGLSLLTKDEKRFYWAAIAGAWQPHIGRGNPRTFGPCGDVLDRNLPMLFSHWERRYPYLSSAVPLAEEGLLVPFYVNGKAVGAIWAIAHEKGREFDAEDLRLLESMGRFASAAYQAVESIEDLRLEIASGEKAETALQALNDELLTRFGVRTRELEQKIAERKQAEKELQRSEAYLAEAQKLSHTGSCGWNVSTGELFWSEETYRIAGLDRSIKPTLQLVLQMIHPEDVAAVRQMLDRAASDGADLDSEHRIVMPDGSVKHVHVLAHAIKVEESGLEYIGAVTDVTATKMAFHKIEELKDQLQTENVALREEVDAACMFEEIVGTSDALQNVLSRVCKVAPTDSTVLITGETGTGKELFARAIHKRSARAGQAFVSVNCAAIPLPLIASELFGHERGAFTGAMQRKPGRFELARGGTLFLDEVGELPAETQVALLRVLQEGEFERVGGTQPVRADVRLIAATNRDLKEAIGSGIFRHDLFYRLNVFPIEVPSLRERKKDIPLLTEYFINRFAHKMGRRMAGISKKTLELFQSYGWPGNIRQLQNVIERSVIVCETETFSVDKNWVAQRPAPTENGVPFRRRLATDEKAVIEAVLAETLGKVAGASGAAVRLGLPSSTLESKIRALKINKRQFIRAA